MIRPMRGQVVIEEIEQQPSRVLWTPTPGARQVTTHTGRVLAMGPPARTPTGAEVEPGFEVGDLVLYRFTFLEKMSTNEWDGRKAHWIPQQDVTAVWYDDAPHAGIDEKRDVWAGGGYCTRCGAEGVLFDDQGREVDLCEKCLGTGLDGDSKRN